MAAHSSTETEIILPVAADQPQSGWPAWLRDIANAVNRLGSSLNKVSAAVPGGVPAELAAKVDRAGDTMTGNLVFSTEPHGITWTNSLGETGRLYGVSGPGGPGGNGTLVVGTSADPGYAPGSIPTTMHVMAQGAKNALVGEVTVDVPGAGNWVGTTGYGKVPLGTQAAVFGLYGLSELYHTSGIVVGGEATARNFSGTNASTAVPPPTWDVSQIVCNGWQISCGTGLGHPPGAAKDASTGLYITNESADPAAPSFANGIVANCYRQYGMYIMDSGPGTRTQLVLDNNGAGINLVLRTTGTAVPSNAVFAHFDSGNVVKSAIFQNGDIHGNSLALAVPLAVGSGGTNKTTWTAGSVAFAASATGFGEDNANLFWDDANNRLGIGTAAPGFPLHVAGGSAALTALLQGSGTDARARVQNLAAASAANSATVDLQVNSSTAGRVACSMQAFLSDTTDATRTSAVIFNVQNAGASIEIMRFAGANVSIGSTTPQRRLTVKGTGTTLGVGDFVTEITNTHATVGDGVLLVAGGPNSADTGTLLVMFNDAGSNTIQGYIARNGAAAVVYATTSDERLKARIQDSDAGLAAVMQIPVRDFEFAADPGRVQQGLLAQELHEIYPDAVHVGGDDPEKEPWGIDYGRLTPLLMRAVQQLAARVEALEARGGR